MKNIFAFILFFFGMNALGQPIHIVAAENFYGQIAEQIGGPQVLVISILSNPQQDPHLFSSTPANAEAIADADILIYNGIDYDPWINNLIDVNGKNIKIAINVAELLNKKSGENPHIWYDPQTMLILATRLTEELRRLDPANAKFYQQRFNLFKQDHVRLLQQIAGFRQQFQGTPVIATEPVYNDMAFALGLRMYGQKFQLSIMNDTEPSVKDTQEFDSLIIKHQVKVLIYNNQVSSPLTDRMKILAQKAGVPIIGISETEPADQNYFTWMMNELNDLINALQLSQ